MNTNPNIKIALAGNPNCGKTTLFNALTGSNQYVGNWPGVTVEKKTGKVKKQKNIEIVDLPGVYSLSPYTPEEIITKKYLTSKEAQVVVNIVDGTNLQRSLYLTTQLLDLKLPVIVALNMADVMKKQGYILDIEALTEKLGCPVIEISALKGQGISDLIKLASSLESKSCSSCCEACSSCSFTKSGTKASLTFNSTEAVSLAEIESSQDENVNRRYTMISEIIGAAVKKQPIIANGTSDKIDSILTNRWLALPMFGAIMFLVYYISVSSLGAFLTDWTNDVLFGEIIPPAVESFLLSVGTSPWLNSLILDGIIGGVGAVLGFVPQLLILFLLLAILEDCGYMSRVAFIMDRVFRRFGLSGKSFIPMLIGTGCSVPGIMASRTIENEAERKITVITTSFIPCGAKLPIIALIGGAFFGGAWWIAPSSYFIGIVAVVISGIILKKLKGFSGSSAPFLMELPPYHMPSPKGVLFQMWDRGWSFIKKAGTVIFVSCGIIWFLSSFDFSLNMTDTPNSILASLGVFLAPIFSPLGFGSWEATVATFTGLVAKENVVGTFGVLFGMSEVSENGTEIWSMLTAGLSVLSAYSFLTFNLLCAPCFAAMGAIRRELGGMAPTLAAIGYQTGFAYTVSLIVYQLGSLFSGQGFTLWTAVAFILLASVTYLIFRRPSDRVSRNLHYEIV